MDNHVAGYCLATVNEAEQGQVFRERLGRIQHIFVEEPYRRTGLGRAMFARLRDWFEEYGVKHVTLSVHVQNDVGQEFWRRLGFADDLFVMRLDL